ncbi:MAG TPA: GNAT family N-acetyltransferase [Bacteroidetes bacterium]|nr:GNAT family N-acetyltransferase [Bacteroidota bacterium]
MALRQDVFVVEQDCPYLDADGKDQAAWHIMGYDKKGNLAAYSRLLPKGISYKKHPSIGRVVTAPSARGSGIGRQLMEQSLAWMEKLFPKEDIKISAQCYLQKFYSGLGFEIAGEEYLEDGIPHFPMLLKKVKDA